MSSDAQPLLGPSTRTRKQQLQLSAACGRRQALCPAHARAPRSAMLSGVQRTCTAWAVALAAAAQAVESCLLESMCAAHHAQTLALALCQVLPLLALTQAHGPSIYVRHELKSRIGALCAALTAPPPAEQAAQNAVCSLYVADLCWALFAATKVPLRCALRQPLADCAATYQAANHQTPSRACCGVLCLAHALGLAVGRRAGAAA